MQSRLIAPGKLLRAIRVFRVIGVIRDNWRMRAIKIIKGYLGYEGY